jgi:hypothetical protein
MKSWKQPTRMAIHSVCVTFMAAAFVTVTALSSHGDDYYQDDDSIQEGVSLASDSMPVESSPTLVPEESMHDHSMNGHAGTEVEEWVDPTISETGPCTKADGKHCPGVCKDPGHPKKPKHPRPGDIDEGDCPSKRYRMDDCLRSGDPNCVYKWAAPSITEKYSAWYVGGGAAFKGRGRKSSEGTWGLDYDGLFGHARTWLNYTCGKEQGGEGAYETDHVPLKKKF